MSLFLSRLSLSKLPLRRHLTARSFSSSSIYYIVGAEPCGSSLKDGDIGNLKIHPLGGDDRITEKKVPMNLLKEKGTIGASHGWVATLNNGVVRLQDDFDPSASDIDPKRISLPPLITLPHCQTNIVTNVAMSSSSPKDEDCIVAIKFLGPQLSLCRPAQKNCKWTNIRITDPGFFSSHVMYSKKNEMFSMPASGGNYTGSWDLGRHREQPKLQMLRYPEHLSLKDKRYASIYELADSELVRRVELKFFDSCCSVEHYLVESSQTGETFMVKWMTDINPSMKMGRDNWEHFHVLRLDNEGNAVYTKDFGGVCFFLSKAEPFCLTAACLHDQRPNCIYHLSDNRIGVTCMDDQEYVTGAPITLPVPYWFPLKQPIKSAADPLNEKGLNDIVID
ncbi:hypothetical protein V5N11_024146 [Cardamine amara subsp. amara]|uniref:KIB1-4 beta-propeller domain-containing protein n=1 Tax=Cardamine amara subsp. amara TaxID=228776 RepID=A0ABD1B9I7_CARAN